MKKDKQYMNLDTLIVDMQSKDNRFGKLYKRMQIMFFVFIFLYGGLFLLNPDSELTLNYRLAGGCYVIAFTLFTLYFRKYYKQFNFVNYADSVKTVLEGAVKRYKLFNKDYIGIGIAILCINAATLLIMAPKFAEKWNMLKAVLLIEALILGAVVVGLIIGVLWWRRDSKPIWLSAKKLLKELEE